MRYHDIILNAKFTKPTFTLGHWVKPQVTLLISLDQLLCKITFAFIFVEKVADD